MSYILERDRRGSQDRFRYLGGLRERVLSKAADSDLSLSVIDGLLMPLATLEAMVLPPSSDDEERYDDAREIIALCSEQTNGILSALRAAADRLGLPEVTIPASSKAIDAFLDALSLSLPALGLVHALFEVRSPAIHALGKNTVVEFMGLVSSFDASMFNLSRLREVRSGAWRPGPGQIDAETLRGDLLGLAESVPPMTPSAPADKAGIHASREDLGLVAGLLHLNAAHHSPASKRPGFGIIRDGRFAAIYFSDEGPGFSSEARVRCLEPFYRGIGPDESSRGARIGIGLTLAAAMADRMGGKLEFGRVGEGERPVLFLPSGPTPSISTTS